MAASSVPQKTHFLFRTMEDWYWALFGCLSVFAIGSWQFQPKMFPIAKPLPVFFLLNPMYTQFGSLVQGLFYIGLIFGVIGDILLLNGHVKKWFLAGLVSFVIGHIFYILGFVLNAKWVFWGTELAAIFVFVCLYCGILVLGLIKRNNTEWMPPVVLYLWIIAAMVVSAINFDLEYHKGSSYSATLGSFLFFVSDSILCVNKFLLPNKFPLWLATTLILGFYYPAQGLIANSTVLSHL